MHRFGFARSSNPIIQFSPVTYVPLSPNKHDRPREKLRDSKMTVILIRFERYLAVDFGVSQCKRARGVSSSQIKGDVQQSLFYEFTFRARDSNLIRGWAPSKERY